MAARKPPRSVARLLVALLVCGFAYSGLAVLRGYRGIFQSAPSAGSSASIDQYLVPAGLRSAAQLREAVARVGWAPGDVLLVAEPSLLSRQDIVQTCLAAGYVLYPRRVFLSESTDPRAEAAARGTRRIIVLGRTNPFRPAAVERVSDVLTLVTLP